MKEAILVGDVGGTKTHLALFFFKDFSKPIAEDLYKSRQFSDFLSLLKGFLKQHPEYKIKGACFGVAGPIQEGKCQATNLPWFLETDLIRKAISCDEVILINDLESTAYGVCSLGHESFFCLNPGIQRIGNQVVIAPGTGLGEAGIYVDEAGRKYPFATEGGHCSFSPGDEQEVTLWRYLTKQFDHVSFERILSGPGLENLYSFLIHEGLEREEEVELAFKTEERARVITAFAREDRSKICVSALKLFVKILAGECANLVLKHLAVGGVYIAGGIAPAILEFLKSDEFLDRFVEKGRFRSLLQNVPVHVILSKDVVLLGALSKWKSTFR